VKLILVALIAFACQSTALAISPKMQACADMATRAHAIIVLKSQRTEQQAFLTNLEYRLPGLHTNILDGVVSMVYAGSVRLVPEDTALHLYTACVMRT